jgi:hypothetical protein
MIEKASQKIIVVVGVLLLLAAFGYFVFNNSEVNTTPEGIIQQDAVGQDIITLAEKMESIHINDSIFTSAVFLSLIDRHLDIVPESQGRVNPFASIGVEGGR